MSVHKVNFNLVAYTGWGKKSKRLLVSQQIVLNCVPIKLVFVKFECKVRGSTEGYNVLNYLNIFY